MAKSKWSQNFYFAAMKAKYKSWTCDSMHAPFSKNSPKNSPKNVCHYPIFLVTLALAIKKNSLNYYDISLIILFRTMCFFTSESTMKKDRFMQQLKVESIIWQGWADMWLQWLSACRIHSTETTSLRKYRESDGSEHGRPTAWWLLGAWWWHLHQQTS